MYCRNCGTEVDAEAITCPECGNDPRTDEVWEPPADPDPYERPPDSPATVAFKVTSAVLAALFLFLVVVPFVGCVACASCSSAGSH